MSPEAFGGSASYGMDVWAFGLIVWQMVTHQRLWADVNIRELLFRGTIYREINAGKVLVIPSESPRGLQDIMRGCFVPAATRWGFDQIIDRFQSDKQ